MKPTQARLKELFRYDPESGHFIRRVTVSVNAQAGMRAGWQDAEGYWRIEVDDRTYRAHRLAWLYVHGRHPVGDLDHINGVHSDNRLANLREATRSQNLANSKQRQRGLKGATLDPRTAKWRARICVNYQRIHLGLFDTEQAAHDAYCEAAKKMQGKFFRAS